jgi:lipopolysaccharide export system permease protein
VSLSRFVRPVLRTTWPVLAVIAVLMFVVWPWGNRNGAELRERYAQRSDLSRVAPGVFQQSSDGKRVFFIERDGADAAQARNVFILSNIGDKESVTSANRGRLETQGEDRVLVLERGQRNDIDLKTGDKAQSSFEDYRVVVGEKAARLAAQQPPRSLGTLALLQDPTPRHQAELSWRIGLTLGAANLLLLGLGLSATQPRRASNWNLLLALLGFVVYYNLINLSQAWIASGRMSMGAALLGLHGGTFLLALALIAWREHATVWRLWPRRGATA